MRAGKVRSPNVGRYDREILYLALPALGALAAEPTYVLVDTAIVGDLDVIERARALWPLFALMQPVGAAVFALDGILIGASDTRFLKWSMVAAFACFAPLALAALALHLGVVGVWMALNVLMAVRLITCGALRRPPLGRHRRLDAGPCVSVLSRRSRSPVEARFILSR